MMRKIITIICLCFYFQKSEGHKENVIFEQIGQLAGSTSYLHVHLAIDLSSIQQQYSTYRVLLNHKFSNHTTIMNFFTKELNQTYSSSTLSSVAYVWAEISKLHLSDILDIGDHLASLQNILPDLPNGSHNKVQTPPTNYTQKGRKSVKTIITDPEHKIHPDNLVDIGIQKPLYKVTIPKSELESDKDPEYTYNTVYAIPIPKRRKKRVAGIIALPLAIAATTMGIYNSLQIEWLKHELLEVKENINRLFQVVQRHDQHIQEIFNAIRDISTHFLVLLVLNPTLFSTRLSRIENQIRDRLRIATHAIQTAQHRRLAVDYLTSQEIRALFSKLKARALELGCELLIEHHSALFQLEVSLLFDGEDAHILIHVPMVPQRSLLRLFKLHPFPLPFFDEHFLIPDVKHDILAISSTDQRFSAQLSSVDLMGCHRVNQVFMCDRFGVLSRRFNNTCLGALYMQDFTAAQSICKFDIVPAAERIYQLKKNWFIVFLPRPQTILIKCRNGTNAELHLARGSQKIHLSPGCEAQFNDHSVTSDLSIKLPADTLHFEWEWDPFAFTALDPALVGPEIDKLRLLGIDRPQLTDLRYLTIDKNQTNHMIHFAGNIVLAVFITIVVIFIMYRCYVRRRARRPPGPIITDSPRAVARRNRAADPNIVAAAAARVFGIGPMHNAYHEPGVSYSAANEQVRVPYGEVQHRVHTLRERESLIHRLSVIDAEYPPSSAPDEFS